MDDSQGGLCVLATPSVSADHSVAETREERTKGQEKEDEGSEPETVIQSDPTSDSDEPAVDTEGTMEQGNYDSGDTCYFHHRVVAHANTLEHTKQRIKWSAPALRRTQLQTSSIPRNYKIDVSSMHRAGTDKQGRVLAASASPIKWICCFALAGILALFLPTIIDNYLVIGGWTLAIFMGLCFCGVLLMILGQLCFTIYSAIVCCMRGTVRGGDTAGVVYHDWIPAETEQDNAGDTSSDMNLTDDKDNDEEDETKDKDE